VNCMLALRSGKLLGPHGLVAQRCRDKSNVGSGGIAGESECIGSVVRCNRFWRCKRARCLSIGAGGRLLCAEYGGCAVPHLDAAMLHAGVIGTTLRVGEGDLPNETGVMQRLQASERGGRCGPQRSEDVAGVGLGKRFGIGTAVVWNGKRWRWW